MYPIFNTRLQRSHLVSPMQIFSLCIVGALLLLTHITTSAAPLATLLKSHVGGQDQEFSSAATAPTAPGNNVFGVVWTDLNRNGAHDELEPVAVGQTIFLTPDIDSDFAQILVLTTDQQGQFQAGNLAQGHYRIWAASQSAADALVITVTDDRTIMTVELPLAAYLLYMPDIRG